MLEANCESKDENFVCTHQWKPVLYEFSIDFSRFASSES